MAADPGHCGCCIFGHPFVIFVFEKCVCFADNKRRKLTAWRDAQRQRVAVWWPLVATVKRDSRRRCFVDTETSKFTPKGTLRNVQSHNTTSEQTPVKHARPWSIILQCVIKISVMWRTEGKLRHSPINQSIDCYEICICLNMEFDLIKPISRTISLCKHLREAEGERECVVVACLENILRVSQCVWGYITAFNWIVLHQCQEVTRYVCRGLSSFWLRAWLSVFSSPLKQANTWRGEKSFSGFKHRQSMWEELRGSRYIKAA